MKFYIEIVRDLGTHGESWQLIPYLLLIGSSYGFSKPDFSVQKVQAAITTDSTDPSYRTWC